MRISLKYVRSGRQNLRRIEHDFCVAGRRPGPLQPLDVTIGFFYRHTGTRIPGTRYEMEFEKSHRAEK